MVWVFDHKKHDGQFALDGLGASARAFSARIMRLLAPQTPEFGAKLAPKADIPTQANPFRAAARTVSQPAAMYAADLSHSVIAVVGASRPVKICLNWLTAQGATLLRSASLDADEPIWTAPRGAQVLIDLDGLGGITARCTDLMRLRLRRPDLVVILLSGEFQRHDFGQERLALGDVSLRIPCSFTALELALAEAEINNWAWAERLEEVPNAT